MNEARNYLDQPTPPVTKKGQLEKKPSNPLHPSIWKQYSFILNNHTLRYVNERTHVSKELRCADIVGIDCNTNTTDAQFPITIYFKGSGRRKLYLRAQSKIDHTLWIEAFRRIQTASYPPPPDHPPILPDCPPDRPPLPPDRPPIPPDRPPMPPDRPPILPDRPPMPPDRPPIPPDRPPIPPDRPPILPDRPPIPPDNPPIPRDCPPIPPDRPPIPPDCPPIPPDRPPIPPDRPPSNATVDENGYSSLLDTEISAPFTDDDKDGYVRVSNHAEGNVTDLAAQINRTFTSEQVLGLTDMLSQLYEHSFKNKHLYVNLEMLLEAVSYKASDTNLLVSDEYQIARPDWAKANTDDFNIYDLVGIDVVAHISPSSITEKKKIGEGQFGDVFIATLHGQSDSIEVAMKTYKNIHNCTQEANFMNEMAQLSQIVHPNIVRMYGIVIEDGQPPAMVMEYLPHADLRTFLTKNARPTSKLVKYMIDIAMAMNYVSEKGLVHRDLAARNVLLDDNELCKVGDFGLLRELPENCDIYVPQSDDPMPYRWLALESLTERRFSVASDVWSYGVLMWEMFKPTEMPYEGFGTFQLVSKLKDGYRLPLPTGIPEVLGNIMKACWKEDPSKRPSFLLICTLLTTRALMLKEADYTYGTIKRN